LLQQTSLPYLRNYHSRLNLSNRQSNQQPPTWKPEPPPAKRLQFTEGSMIASIFSKKVFLKKMVYIFRHNTVVYLIEYARV
jgi:hypothetical protein